uniref:Uncharacterized protein n=1 Tax=Trichobilharzia regenti TaxID=157069 RepID=A0AA85JFD1_TRIRE|nr:unnamed protein product [Trichobilharzia regenti]
MLWNQVLLAEIDESSLCMCVCLATRTFELVNTVGCDMIFRMFEGLRWIDILASHSQLLLLLLAALKVFLTAAGKSKIQLSNQYDLLHKRWGRSRSLSGLVDNALPGV